LLLVLVVLTGSLALVAGIHPLLRHRAALLRIQGNRLDLQTALLLALREGMALLAGDTQLAVDHPEEEWARPRRLRAESGVEVELRLYDAQNRINLNHLSLAASPLNPRSVGEMWSDLLQTRPPAVALEALKRLERVVQSEKVWLAVPEEIILLQPAAADWLAAHPGVSALPNPAGRPLPVNLNSVEEDVLVAMTGSSLAAWARQVLSARAQAPLQSAAAQLHTLPPTVVAVLAEQITVRSDLFELRALAVKDGMPMELMALLRRAADGEVEVLQCRW
jgi:type II secretory pathway component PulK